MKVCVTDSNAKDAVTADDRVILTAKRRFGKENEPEADNQEPEKRGMFKLAGTFSTTAVANTKPAFNFAKAFESNPKLSEESKAIAVQDNLAKEQKVFVNKNLFCNPSIRPIPSVTRKTADEQPVPKLEESERPHFVSANLLSSSKALKFKDEVAKPPRNETPIVKSLFDYEDNKVFKEEETKQAKPEPVNPFKSNAPAVNPFAGLKTTGNPFASFKNPFQPDPSKVSAVFATSLYDKPVEKPAFLKKQEEEAKSSPEVSPTESPNASPVEETKITQTVTKQFQSQILKLKVLKGVGVQNPQPSTKGDGFLSIENG